MTEITRSSGKRKALAAVDLRVGAMDVCEVQVLLKEIAGELSILSSTAMTSGDFDEITRLVEAAQAVHRALVSLREDEPQPAQTRV